MTNKNKIVVRRPRPLNAKELAVLRQCFDGASTLKEIAKRFRRAKTPAQANSWARNNVRRPVQRGLLKKSGRGTYTITAKGISALDDHAARAAA